MDVSEAQVAQTRIRDEVGVRCQKLFHDFLEEYKEDGKIKYLDAAKQLLNPERSTLEVCFEDVEKYNQNLATSIIEEYYRIYPFLCQAVHNFVKDRSDNKTREEASSHREYFVAFTDVATRHKVRELTTAKIGTLIRISGQVVRTHPVHPELVLGTFTCLECQTVIKDVEQQFKFTNPTICRNPVCSNRRRFMLEVDKSVFVDFQKVRIQETQAELPRGCIPRSVEVILRGDAVESVQAGDRYDFTGTLIVVPDVGALALPGAKAEMDSRHKAGETNTEGVQGLQALGVRELHYRMAFLACSVQPTNPRFGGGELLMEEITAEMMKQQMTDVEWKKVYDMSRDRNLYQNLVDSLFPSIHGNDEVKKGIVLQLFGGVPKTTTEGTTLRGDINCCIVGDPSTAKSQLLKQKNKPKSMKLQSNVTLSSSSMNAITPVILYGPSPSFTTGIFDCICWDSDSRRSALIGWVADFSPRAIYTSGKASSAAGLTAAVVKDEESFDFVIEAGALMLADNGICCIDEFDKMDPRDQVAIHEAMEQQTISIAKAGVRATLNARTSILAAANPIGGRYDRTKSLQQNIALTAPIMSRFDLFFILVDECNEIVDYAIARKIVDLHSNIEESVTRVYSQEEVLRYITFARLFKPVINEEAANLLVEQYKHLRQRDTLGGGKSTWRITVRQLESMIRLSEAMAKMECSDEVQPKHVKEAYRLLNKSIIRVEQPDIHFDEEEEEQQDEPMELEGAAPQSGENVPNGVASDEQDSAPVVKKKKLTLSFEEYKSLSTMLVVHMRNEESKLELEGKASEGLKRSDLVSWYLEQIQEQFESEEELLEKKALIEKVIDRLTFTDNIIIPLMRKGLKGQEEGCEDDPFLVVHPNYILAV